MGFTGILGLLVIALLAVTIYAAAKGARAKSWRQIILPIAIFCAIVAAMYFGLLTFLTSM